MHAFLLIGLICGFIAQSIGKNRKCGPQIGFLWGFFLGIIGVLVVLILPAKEA